MDKTNEHFLNKRSVTTKSPRIQRGWENCGPAFARCLVASSDLGSLANIGTRGLHSDGQADGRTGRPVYCADTRQSGCTQC